MSTYVVVPKRIIPDDILDGLINDNKIYDGPLGNFYTSCKKIISQLITTNTAIKDSLSKASESKDYKQLRSILVKINSEELDGILSFKDSVTELDAQEEKIKSDLPSVKIVSSSVNSITVSLDIIKMTYKDIKKSDFWEIEFKNPTLTIFISTQSNKVFVSKILCNFSHPYAGGDKTVRISGSELPLGENFIYDAISYSINYLKMFNQEKLLTSIDAYIGKKCSITGLYTYGKGVTCVKTGDHLLTSEAKIIKGRYYSPKIVKECSKCNKESVNWISSNKVIICGECNDIP